MTRPSSGNHNSLAVFEERRRHDRQFGYLSLMYGDTLPDGGHMTPKMQFSNEETLKAIAHVITAVGRQPMIAEDLQRRVAHKPAMVEHDPDDQKFDRLTVMEEEARQIRGTLEELADDRYPFVDDVTLRIAKVMDSRSLRRLAVPTELSPEQQQFYSPNQSYHELETKAAEERIMAAQSTYPQ